MDYEEEEDGPEIYPGVDNDFDLEMADKVSVWTAKFFVEDMGYPLDKALAHFKITQEQYDKWKDEP